MESKIIYQVGTEALKNRYNKLKDVIDELENLGVLVNENLEKLRLDIQDILSFCRADYKFSFLIQGEMNAGKSTFLNALLGQRILAVSSVPETNFITCVVYDRESETPLLYKTALSKIYDSQTSNFHVSDEDLEFTGVSGTENIYQHLNKSNQKSRKEIKEFEEQLEKNRGDKDFDSKRFKENFYKDFKLNDTVYVIKCRIKSLEKKIKDEFILKRIQLIDFPGMFEYGQNKITEIYKIFEENTQGLMSILHPLDYKSHVITKLQNHEKYHNRLFIIINKMDQITDDNDDEVDSNNEDDIDDKASKLVKNLQDSLSKIGNHNSSNDSQKTKYLKMSQEAPSIIHFVAGKEEMMSLYLQKYRKSTDQHEKDLYDSILKSFAEDDQTYRADLRKAKKEHKPFAEMGCFEFFGQDNNSLFDKIRERMADKFRHRFNDLVAIDYPKKVNMIRDQLVEFIEKLMKEGSVEKNGENTHIFYKCDGCGMDPIVGVRYHCTVCNDFDFCEKCMTTKEHPPHEFQKIEKFCFMDYAKDYCCRNSIAIIQFVIDFKVKFCSQLEKLLANLKEGFRMQKGQNFFKDLLTSQCDLYSKTLEEIEERFKTKAKEFSDSLIILFAAWEVDSGPAIQLIFIETLCLVAKVINVTKKSLALVSAASTNVLQDIILSVLEPGESAEMVQELYQNVDLTALILTNVFNSEQQGISIQNFTDQTQIWNERFQKVLANIIVDPLQLSQNITEKIERTINIAEVLDTIFQKDLNEKLASVLEKVKNIATL